MKNKSVSDFVAATMDAVLNSAEHKALFSTQYKFASDSSCAKCGHKHGDMDSCMADDNDARKAKKDSKESSSDSSDASDQNDARKKKDSSKDSSGDSSSADDNDARGGKKCSDCGKPKNFCKCDSSKADDNDHVGSGAPKDRDHGEYDNHFADDNDAKKKKDSSKESSSDSSDANDKVSGSGVGSDPYVFPTDKITGKPSKADDGAADDLEVAAAYDVAIDSLLSASAALDSVGLDRGSVLTLKIASLVVEAKKKEKDSKKSKKDSKKDSKKSDKKDSQSAKDKKSDSKKDDKKDSKKSDKKDDKKSSKK